MFLLFVFALGSGQMGVEAGPVRVSCSASTVTLKATPINPPSNYMLEWEGNPDMGSFYIVNPSETTTYRVYLTDLDTNTVYEDTARVLVHPGDPDVFPDGELNEQDWLAFFENWQNPTAAADFDPDEDGKVSILDFFYFCNFDVDPPNTPPRLQIGNAITYREESVNIAFTIEDDEQTPQLVIARDPAHGVVFPLGGELIYDPDPGFTGIDRFEVYVTDGFITTLNREVEVEVLVPDTWDDLYNDIFFVSCKACHIDAASGGLSLLTYANAQTGGISGASFIAGNPDQSPLYLRVANDSMPLLGSPLSEFEKERIRLWILRGAAP